MRLCSQVLLLPRLQLQQIVEAPWSTVHAGAGPASTEHEYNAIAGQARKLHDLWKVSNSKWKMDCTAELMLMRAQLASAKAAVLMTDGRPDKVQE